MINIEIDLNLSYCLNYKYNVNVLKVQEFFSLLVWLNLIQNAQKD